MAKQHKERLAREQKEKLDAERELAEKKRLREEVAEKQRKADEQRAADEAAAAKHKRDEAEAAAAKKRDAEKAEAKRQKDEADAAAAKKRDAENAEAKRKKDEADAAAAKKREADAKAVADRKAKEKAKKDAEARKRDPSSPEFVPRNAAEKLAVKKGMKPAPDGYNWRTIMVDGEDVPVIARSPRKGGNPRPKIRWNSKTKDFETVSKSWESFEYEDFVGAKKKPCFPPGTIVKTPNGDTRIEELVAGDIVWSFDLERGERVSSRVTQVYRNWTHRLATLTAGTEQIVATRMHRFWVASLSQWHVARSLWPAMTLQSLEGEPLSVTNIDVVDAQSATYNLEIDDTHTYFVGARGVLVHNGPSEDSIFAETATRRTFIYRVWEIAVDNGQKVKRTIYVGKTFQGEGVQDRFSQHLKDPKKPTWAAKFNDNMLNVEAIADGEWTEYETAVWEKHFIERYRLENPGLLNEGNPIGKAKFNKFRDLDLPCK